MQSVLRMPGKSAVHQKSPKISRCLNCPKWRQWRAAWMRECAATASWTHGLARIASRTRLRRPGKRKDCWGDESCRSIAPENTSSWNLEPGQVGSADASASPENGEIEAQWIVHLGMTGRLLVTTPEAPVAKHTHARLTLKSGREIRFVDPRRFGRLDFQNLRDATGKKENGFIAKGSEPLSIDAEEFANLFRGRKLAIKAALLNQSLLSGVGNIYADESLFRAGIRPRRSAGRLTRVELEKLRRALREVLEHAIRLGGSSVSDYVDAEGVRGFFQLEHRVYQRTGEPCLTVQRNDQADCGGRSQHSLLSELSEIGRGRESRIYCFLKWSRAGLLEFKRSTNFPLCKRMKLNKGENGTLIAN